MGFIYLLQREADIRYRSYKIGRTTRFIADRIHGAADYRRATIYVVRLVKDVELVERMLIDTFKGKFVQTCTQYADFGVEDFICDVRQAIAIVNEICDQYIPLAQPPPVPLAQDVQPNAQPIRTEKSINGLTKEADILPKPDKHGWIVPDDDCELNGGNGSDVGANVKAKSELTRDDLKSEPTTSESDTRATTSESDTRATTSESDTRATQSSFNFKPSSSEAPQQQSNLSKEWDEWQAKQSMRTCGQQDVKNDEVSEQPKTKPKTKTTKRATKSKKTSEQVESDTQKEPEKPKTTKPKAKRTKKVKQEVKEDSIPSPQTSETSSVPFGFTHSPNPWQNNSNTSLFTGLVKDETIEMINPFISPSSDKPILQTSESSPSPTLQAQSPPHVEQDASDSCRVDNEIPDEPVHQKRGASFARFVEIPFSIFKDIFRCYDENLYEIMMFGMFSKYYPHIQVVVSPAYTEGHHERPKYCCKIADIVKITDIRYIPRDFEHIQSISSSNISDPYLVAVIQINIKNGYVVCVSDQPMFNPVNIKMYYLPNIGLRQEIAAREYDGILTTPVKLHVSKVGKSWNYSINYM